MTVKFKTKEAADAYRASLNEPPTAVPDNDRAPIVYVSGPMRGIEDFNFPAFDFAAGVLRTQGYEVISPSESFERRTDLPAETYLRKDVTDLLGVDMIVVLPGWRNSVGVKVELTIAAALKIPVLEFEANGLAPWDHARWDNGPKLNLDYLLVPIGQQVGEPTKKVEQETALQAANRIVHGERQKNYGHPHRDFSKTAAFWSVLFGVEVKPWQVAQAMILLKLSRLMQTPTHYDSIVDVAGYAGTYDLVMEKAKELGEIA